MSATTPPTLLWRMTPHAYAWRPADGRTAEDGIPGILLRGIADAVHGGYDGLEASLSWVGGSPQAAAAARRSLEGWELGLDCLFVQVSTGIPDEALGLLVEQAVQAVPLGYRFLNVVTVPPAAERRRYPAGYDGAPVAIARVLVELARRLEPHGLAVCWHPHETALQGGARLAEETVERSLGAPVRLCLDLGCVVRAGEDPVDLLRRFGPVVRTLHVRDVAPDGRWCESVGEGVLDLPAVAKALSDLPALGACAVEMKYDRDTRVTRTLRENARLSAEVLRGIDGWPTGGTR
ncbi:MULTISPECIES: sugar phosphate isomerase/epimerase family protein [Kitasatospora]|uniref:Xylose isomerase-like TIM barrel domain-containing protein n=1 Tax=Kitasatospora cystarginea TaxID=58350 RepID=A0ABN3DDP8_9ACTN